MTCLLRFVVLEDRFDKIDDVTNWIVFDLTQSRSKALISTLSQNGIDKIDDVINWIEFEMTQIRSKFSHTRSCIHPSPIDVGPLRREIYSQSKLYPSQSYRCWISSIYDIQLGCSIFI